MGHRLQASGRAARRPVVSHGDMLERLHTVLYEEVAESVKRVYKQETIGVSARW